MVASMSGSTGPAVSLAGAAVVDAHCHGWRVAEALALDPHTFLDRVTLTGMCLVSGMDGELLLGTTADELEHLTSLTPFALAMQGRLAGRLGVAPTREEVSQARHEAYARDPAGHMGGLWDDAAIAGLFVDDGSPRIPSRELEDEIGVPVLRVARIEPWIEELREGADGYDELEDAFCARAEREVAAGLVAFKSVIGYLVGLDVGELPRAEVAAAFDRWRASGFAEERALSKPVRDALLVRALDIARAHDVPFHVHCGAGDSSIVLEYARPKDLFPLLKRRTGQAIVLVHAGWPWVEEGAYLAAVFPNVHLDTSVTTPWYSLALEQKLETMLGLVSAAKIMHGSDHHEPESIWLTAVLAREALERILARGVEHGWFDAAAARRIGESILGANVARLHGVESRLAQAVTRG